MLKQSKIFLEKDIKTFSREDALLLSKILQYHSDLYYNKNTSIISDKEYDILFKKIEELEKIFGETFEITLQV